MVLSLHLCERVCPRMLPCFKMQPPVWNCDCVRAAKHPSTSTRFSQWINIRWVCLFHSCKSLVNTVLIMYYWPYQVDVCLGMNFVYIQTDQPHMRVVLRLAMSSDYCPPPPSPYFTPEKHVTVGNPLASQFIFLLVWDANHDFRIKHTYFLIWCSTSHEFIE